MIQNVGSGGHHDGQGVPVALEVRDEDLDAEVGLTPFELTDGGGKNCRATVVQVVAGHRGDHHVAQVEPRDGLGQAHRLAPVHGPRAAGFDVAEATVARTGVAQKEKRRRAEFAPALANIGTGRLFADRVQPLLAHELLQLLEVRPMRKRHLQPLRPPPNDRRRSFRRKRLGPPRPRDQ